MSRMSELSAAAIDDHRERLHANHSRSANASFWIRSRLLIARRLLRNIASGDQFHRYTRAAHIPNGSRLLADDEHRLYTTADPREQELELGKVQNLRVAAAAVDGVVLEPGETFSFWRAAGRPSRGRDYVTGRELRQGCMIASTGGGICQLTNAISRVASRAGMEIVERHSHTLHPPGFFIDDTTDATVYWNYVDLRFRAPVRVRLGSRLTRDTLVVRLDALP
jgi:vancomycin resistance protein VanW